MAYPGYASADCHRPTDLAVDSGTNTLYVTNASRLDAEAPADAVGTPTSSRRSRKTDGVNGVNAGLLLVDGLVEWNGWNANSCSPDARNAVAKAIGSAIDAANAAAGGTIKNIVIVGGDGVIPMAAVPDLTEYSNESTFARRCALDANGNEQRRVRHASAVASSSATTRTQPTPVSRARGDHELYVPDRNIGRLVETADEIIGQLDNFADLRRQARPADVRRAVTGYDFLDDGAQAVVDELDAAVPDRSSLLDNAWDSERRSSTCSARPRQRTTACSRRTRTTTSSHCLPALPTQTGSTTTTDLVEHRRLPRRLDAEGIRAGRARSGSPSVVTPD